jgi:hypothetical protein
MDNMDSRESGPLDVQGAVKFVALRGIGGQLRVDDEFLVTCPYCGEQGEIFVERDVHGSFVQDCEVCCNPWLVRVEQSADDDERCVSVSRADGSE